MVCLFHLLNHLLNCFVVRTNFFNEGSQLFTGIWQLLFVLEILVKALLHTLKITPFCECFEKQSLSARLIKLLKVVISIIDFTEFVLAAKIKNAVLH